MRYLYIELNEYKRFALNGISKFAMTITETLQLILGTNGSGKSSLLGELTPLPPQHTDFAKTGSKVIKIEHHGKHYVLKSTFQPSQKHSFECDLVELNEGGTITVQKDLVKSHFGIDADVHDLMQGREHFTSMSPARRKEWFLQLCDTNYDYAIKVYNKLKERHRDASGAIKMAKKKLVEESEKLIQSDEEERLHEEAKALHECLSQLLEIRKPVEEDLDSLSINQRDLDTELQRAGRALDALLTQSQDGPWLRLEVIEGEIAAAQDERSRCHALMESFSTEHLANERKIKVLQAAEQQTIETLQVDVQTLTEALQGLRNAALVQDPQLRARTAWDAFQTVKAPLLEVFSAIPSNKEKRFSQQNLQAQREEMNRLTVLKANLSEQLEAKTHRKRHMEAHKDKPDLTCPACNHRFSLNYNDKEYAQVCALSEELQRRLTHEVAPAMKKVEEYLQELGEYSQLYRQYVQLVQNWPALRAYWDYLSEQRVITDEPGTGLHHLSLIERDLMNQLTIEDQQEQLAEKNRLLVSLRDVGGADLQTLIEANAALQTQLTEVTLRLQQATNRLSRAQQARTTFTTVEAIRGKMCDLIAQKQGLFDTQVETLRRMHFNAAVREVQSALAQREHVLGNLSRQKAVVDSIAQQIRDFEKEEEALGILVKQMSPTEGLIAEGLLGFINNFVAQMNHFIKQIWAYPLLIRSCEVLEGASVDLDYKFPMAVQTATNVVSDVAKGSEGMKEIVNLAYRMVALQYLGLQDAPLMLDEFARTFDETHRSQATAVIKALVEQHSFPQLFMVSHYEASYGALSNAEICLLNGMNITVPSTMRKVNSHVVMS